MKIALAVPMRPQRRCGADSHRAMVRRGVHHAGQRRKAPLSGRGVALSCSPNRASSCVHRRSSSVVRWWRWWWIMRIST